MADYIDTTCTTASDTDSDYSDQSVSDTKFLGEKDTAMFIEDTSGEMITFNARNFCVQPYQFEPAFAESEIGDGKVDCSDEEDSMSDRLMNTN